MEALPESDVCEYQWSSKVTVTALNSLWMHPEAGKEGLEVLSMRI